MSKEQIEEMALTICKNRMVADGDDICRKCKQHEACLYQDIACGLYRSGYRKQSEGEWIDKPTGDNFFIGYWILVKPRRINRNATYKCSVCGKLCSSYYNDVGEWKHCPHCGRSMTGVARRT